MVRLGIGCHESRLTDIQQRIEHAETLQVTRWLLHQAAEQRRAIAVRDHTYPRSIHAQRARVAAQVVNGSLQVGGGHVERHPSELGDAHLGADPGAGRGLAENEADGAAGKDPELLPASPFDLQLAGQVERELEIVGAPGSDPREAPALERLRDADVRHGAMLLRTPLDIHRLIFYILFVRIFWKT